MSLGRASEPELPHFIVVGAVKAATTWTAYNLREHPGIFMPGPEPHYYSTEYHRGRDWYASLFSDAPAGAMIGEKSADYLAHPESARRIAQLLPSVRVIVQLRAPVERAYSEYCMLLRRGVVTSAPENYFVPSNRLSDRFLRSGLYAGHLAQFYSHFPRHLIKVVLYEDIEDRPRVVLREIFDHIGIDVRINPNVVEKRINASETALLPLPLRRMLKPFKQVARPMRNWAWFRSLHSTMARPVKYPPFNDDLRQRLRDFYLSDIAELQRMIGRDLSPWLRADIHSSGRMERKDRVSKAD